MALLTSISHENITVASQYVIISHDIITISSLCHHYITWYHHYITIKSLLYHCTHKIPETIGTPKGFAASPIPSPAMASGRGHGMLGPAPSGFAPPSAAANPNMPRGRGAPHFLRAPKRSLHSPSFTTARVSFSHVFYMFSSWSRLGRLPTVFSSGPCGGIHQGAL